MRRIVIAAVALASLAAGTLVIERSRATNDEQMAKDAERAFVANLAKGDQKAIGSALDRRFTWTDTEGLTRNRRGRGRALAAATTGNDSDVQTSLSPGADGAWNPRRTRFLQFSSKRRHGWKAFVVLRRCPRGRRPRSSRPQAQACDVPAAPCHAEDAGREILAAWRRPSAGKPDAAQWANFVPTGS
jgi:hypothetical protein